MGQKSSVWGLFGVYGYRVIQIVIEICNDFYLSVPRKGTLADSNRLSFAPDSAIVHIALNKFVIEKTITVSCND